MRNGSDSGFSFIPNSSFLISPSLKPKKELTMARRNIRVTGEYCRHRGNLITIPAALGILLCLVLGCGTAGKGAPHGKQHENPVLIEAEAEAASTPDYDFVYKDSELPSFHITVSEEDWKRMFRRPFKYVKGAFTFKDEVYKNVGIRVKGNSSASVKGYRKSFKVQFDRYDKDVRFHGIAKLNLHNGFKDPSFMREKLSWDLFRAAGVPASRASHVKLYVTAGGLLEKKYFGVYTSTEQVGRDFLRDRFSDEGAGVSSITSRWKGNLFKVEFVGDSLVYRGEKQERYEKSIELKTNKEKKDYTGFIRFLKILNETPAEKFKAEIEKVFNVDGFLKWIAVNTLLSNMDSYAGSGHNYYLYHNPKTGRFEFIPWDLNESFGNFKTRNAKQMLDLDIYYPTHGPKVLIDRILDVPEFEKSYREIMGSLLEKQFSESRMHGKIDAAYKRIKEAVHADTIKQYSNKEFDDSIVKDVWVMGPRGRDDIVIGLKPFVTRRIESVRAQLKHKRKKRERKNDNVERFMREFDKDGDKKVSRAEFPGPDRLFDAFDWNEDGYIDGKEAAHLPPPPRHRKHRP
jgi:spore coat protein CotH